MPELPEVETVARDLADRVTGRKIVEVTTNGIALRIGSRAQAVELKALAGDRFERVSRRGKYLLFDCEPRAKVLLVHLGMTGRLEVVPASRPQLPHTHLVMQLEGGSETEQLRFSDPRRFGTIAVYDRNAVYTSPELRVVGIEPLDPNLTAALLSDMLAKTRGVSIKDFLMSQKAIAGIGNIYASEILFASGIRPQKRAAALTKRQIGALHGAIREVISNAISRRGTTFRDYVDTWGRAGENQLSLQVFQREGEPCFACEKPIVRFVSQGRSTFYCRQCQR